jgi:hypothetical protein
MKVRALAATGLAGLAVAAGVACDTSSSKWVDDSGSDLRRAHHDGGAGADAATEGGSLSDARMDAPTVMGEGSGTSGGPPADAGTQQLEAGAAADAGSGTAWYVSRSGSNADGRSWASAWNELDQIKWSAVQPGDKIEVEGGTYSQRLIPIKGGTNAGRITLERSTAPGHDGKVTIDYTNTPAPTYWAGHVVIGQPYLTIDGKDWDDFEIIANDSCLMIVDTNNVDDYFELKNTRLRGYANPDNDGRTICIWSGSLALDHVWFGTQVGVEDHMVLANSTPSSVKIEHSVFSPWITINGSHSDMLEEGVNNGGALIFKRNIVWDSGPGGGNLVFTGPKNWASVDISYNVFKDTSEVFQLSSLGSQRISNNVFYNVAGTFGGDDSWEAANNIFYAPPDNVNIVWGHTPSYSLWLPGTYGYNAEKGNIVGDAKFLDPTSVLGADGIPFTADDGFNIQSGSAAIGNGIATTDTSDICGRPIVGAPDIGAYEHP